MTEPAKHWRYSVTDILGDENVFIGEDPSNLGPVFNIPDGALLHCEGDVFVNVANVVALKAVGPVDESAPAA